MRELLDLMAAKKLAERTQFVAVLNSATVVVLPGARFPADHPVVKAHRDHFDPPASGRKVGRPQVR
jgi:hypothetical protein